MNPPNIFNRIAKEFKKIDIPYVLIGGFAVNYYGVTRQTVDIDFLLAKEDFERIIPTLRDIGYVNYRAEVTCARFKGAKQLLDIDFVFVDRETINEIIKDGEITSISGEKFIVPSLNNLIALKLHALKHNFEIREYKDFPDIINLVRINKVNTKTKEFKDICLKYGTEGLYNRILKSAP